MAKTNAHAHTFESICRDVKAKQFAPVYVLMGDEPYFIDQITLLITQYALDDTARDFNQILLYGAEANAGDILNAARRFPMMSERQLVVVREAQLIRDIEQLTNYVKKPLPSTILVLNYKYKTLDRRKMLAAAVEANGVLFDSKKLYDNKVPAFVTAFLQERATAIDPKAAQMLADAVGADLNRLVQELSKLLVLLSPSADGNTPTVTPEMVETNIGISKDYNNFELLSAIASRNIFKANRIAHHFGKNAKNNPIQMTLPVLFNYFSNLLICHYSGDHTERGIMSALRLAPFQVRDYATGMRNYTAGKALRAIGNIRQADAQSKGVDSTSSDSEILKELLYKILH